jgi:sentrin-specific protease 1
VHILNTFFLRKLQRDGYGAIKRWTRSVNVFQKELILVPVHLGNHWCMMGVNVPNKCITYYDSMGGRNWRVLETMRSFLVSEARERGTADPEDVQSWKLVCCADTPQQQNGSDCGVFACVIAEHLARRAPLAFTQEQMPYFRRRIAGEIIFARLLT